MTKQQTTGNELLELRRQVLAAYQKAHDDKVTMLGAFGLGAHMIQIAMDCDFRVACMLMDCWMIEHTAQAQRGQPP